jgi:hypothetical protein
LFCLDELVELYEKVATPVAQEGGVAVEDFCWISSSWLTEWVKNPESEKIPPIDNQVSLFVDLGCF